MAFLQPKPAESAPASKSSKLNRAVENDDDDDDDDMPMSQAPAETKRKRMLVDSDDDSEAEAEAAPEDAPEADDTLEEEEELIEESDVEEDEPDEEPDDDDDAFIENDEEQEDEDADEMGSPPASQMPASKASAAKPPPSAPPTAPEEKPAEPSPGKGKKPKKDAFAKYVNTRDWEPQGEAGKPKWLPPGQRKKAKRAKAEASAAKKTRQILSPEDKAAAVAAKASNADPNKMVKRSTLSSYMLYGASVRDSIKSENPELKQTEIMKKTGEMWKALSEEEKKPFVDEAAKLKEDEPLISAADLAAEKKAKADKAKKRKSTGGDGRETPLKQAKTGQKRTKAPNSIDSPSPMETETETEDAPSGSASLPTSATKATQKPAVTPKPTVSAKAGFNALFNPKAVATKKKEAAANFFKPKVAAKPKLGSPKKAQAPKKVSPTKSASPTKQVAAIVPTPPKSPPPAAMEIQTEDTAAATTATATTATATAATATATATATVTTAASDTCDLTKKNYDPVADANWDRGEPVPYSALASTFTAMETISGKLEKIRILRNFLRSVIVLTPDDLATCAFMCVNDLAPAYEGLELGIGDSVLISAVSEATGRSKQKIKEDMAKKEGDLGNVAEASKSNQKMISFGAKPKALMIGDVFKKYQEIARIQGNSSQKKKIGLIKQTLIRCKGAETRFFVRGLAGKLRIGLAIGTLMPALGDAIAWNDPQQTFPPTVNGRRKGESQEKFEARVEKTRSIIKNAFVQYPSWHKVLAALMKHGLDELPNHISITPGIPVEPMLAKPTKGIAEVLSRFDGQKFACEWKYDGERAQVHLLEDGTVKIFSRSSEDNTGKYPDVVARMKDMLCDGVTSLIIDCESVAYDIQKEAILPFQVLSTRKKKDASTDDVQVQVCLFPFDLMYLNGKSYLDVDFGERRELLRKSVKETKGQLHFATSHVADDADEIAELLDLSIKENTEGLMVKTMDGTYEIAKRSHSWLKLKKDYLDGVGDTLDLVPIGAWHGKGKRAGTFGAYLLACYDPETEEYQSICKIGTGFSDEALKAHSAFFAQHTIGAPKEYYQLCDADNTLVPDAWFEPSQVWEVKAADLSISPKHKAAAGIVDPNKGISLRFPRFLRIRDDKKVEQSTSAQQVAEMYSNQAVVKNSAAPAAVFDDEDW